MIDMAQPQQERFELGSDAFGKVTLFVQCAPKLAFQSTEQAKTKDGVPMWEAEVLGSQVVFGKPESKVIKVTIYSDTDPGIGMGQFQPVELVGLAAVVRGNSRKDDLVPGFKVSYSASSLRNLTEEVLVPGKAA
jgi:hypothetical protein